MLNRLSDQLGHVHRHLIDLRRVILLYIPQDLQVLVPYEVYCHSFSSETPTSTYSMDIELSIRGKIIVDNQRDLLNIQPATPQISCNQYSGISLPELTHDTVSFLLAHVSVHVGDRKVALNHLLGQPLDLGLGVTENNRLSDG